ncbi:nuclear transport factor 2 family protein [Salsipaludibacter albus]|uniref:nuclear transport factor 2 family protein n=1 Tax=Salsipaludibacter albus TaxID=2849650 RepID=UPI001EE3DEB5|nr:nuclear transport factor 2 family protein [Salsipaludibacter albus]MBY5161910.1 hypothetical protein [Salsipaludibacter albus]
MSSPRLEVNVDADCGNAPRKAQVRDWLISLAEADVDTVCSQLDDDVRWDVAGSRVHSGIDEVRCLVEGWAEDHVSQLRIRHLLSHGKQVCAEGATSTRRFVHVVTYTSHGRAAKIAEIVTYHAAATEDA